MVQVAVLLWDPTASIISLMWLISASASVLLLQRAVPPGTRAAVRCQGPDDASVDLAGDGGCLLQRVRAPLAFAQRVEPDAIANVHFTASLADGTLLRDSREDAPLEVRVGMQPSDAVSSCSAAPLLYLTAPPSAATERSQVLGWDLALPRMAVGELVRLHCAAPYAYGERGAPPLIPPNTAVIFELELVSLRYLQSSHNEEEVRRHAF